MLKDILKLQFPTQTVSNYTDVNAVISRKPRTHHRIMQQKKKANTYVLLQSSLWIRISVEQNSKKKFKKFSLIYAELHADAPMRAY